MRYVSGVVVDNKDPDKLGRLKVEVPELLGKGKTWPDWIRAAAWPAGPSSSGLVFIPPINATVVLRKDRRGLRWVAGEAGNVNTFPSPFAGDRYPKRSGFTAPGGSSHYIALDDDQGLIIDTTQDAVVQADGAATFRSRSGAVTLRGATTATARAPAINLQAGETAPTQPLLFGTPFLSALTGAAAELVTIGAAMSPPIPTPNATALIAGITASLASGAPYLSNVVKTD